MSCVINRLNVDLESRGITEKFLTEIFDIEEVSAKELLSGKIAFTKNEIITITQHLGIDAGDLLGGMV